MHVEILQGEMSKNQTRANLRKTLSQDRSQKLKRQGNQSQKRCKKCFAKMECRGRCRDSIIATENSENSISEQPNDDCFIHFFSKNSL